MPAGAALSEAASDYDFTTKMLYCLCKIGARVDIMDYGANVAWDLMQYSLEMESAAAGKPISKPVGFADMLKKGMGGVH
jgi:hypothetical protein